MIGQLTNHLWQSTLFALVAGLLTFVFRRNRAPVRYWLWFSASFKFFVPFSLLMSLGSHLEWTPAAQTIATKIASPAIALTVDQIIQPFPDTVSVAPSTPSITQWLLVAIPVLWACGFLGVALMRLADWQRIRAAVRSGALLQIPAFETPPGVEIRCSPGLMEPGVVGLLRPILLLPAGLTERLTPPQLHAVLAHELCHLRRRDNLFAAIHMVAEAIFWFHPLVWWIGARLVEERERTCDEEVLSLTGEPQIYAEGILNVCKLYVESPLACVSGVTGSNLKRRIEAIMTNRVGIRLGRTRKFLLASAGFAALAGPLLMGVCNAPAIRAQPAAAARQFDVASVKPINSGANTLSIRIAPGGRLTASNASLGALITAAYQIRYFQLSGGPAWRDSAKYDIQAKGQLEPGIKADQQINQMLQSLLADRFQLRIHKETKELPVYALLIAKNGPKLEPSRDSDCFDPASGLPPPVADLAAGRVRPCGGFNGAPGQLSGAKVTMTHFASTLSNVLRQTVVDKTGLDGAYDISLRWAPEATPAFLAPDAAGQPPPADNSGPSIFSAVREQLGLRLESQKGPVEILVIDHAEKPSEN